MNLVDTKSTNKSINKNICGSYGFAIPSILLSISMMSISMLSFLSKVNMGNQESEYLSHQTQRQSIEFAVKKIIESNICTCHFDSTQNTNISSASLKINTISLEDIPLEAIRTGCDFNSADNILIQEGESLEDGLVIDTIKVSNMSPKEGSNKVVLGDIIIGYTSEGNTRNLHPSAIPVSFTIDPNSGSNESRPIKECKVPDDDNDDESSPSGFPCYFADTETDWRGRTLFGCGISINENQSRFTTSFGFGAGKSSGSSNSNMGNTYFGYEAGMNHQSSESTMIGYRAGKMSVNLKRSNLIGYQAGGNVISGQDLHFIGAEAGLETLRGNSNIFIGASAGRQNLVGNKNIFLGYEAGRNGTTTHENIFIGYRAGFSNTKNRNVFIGSQAGEANVLGEDSVVIGYRAGYKNPLINKSVFVGTLSGSESNGGDRSVFIGYSSGQKNEGNYNTFIGNYTGVENTDGEENVFVGHRSGESNSSGSKNTFLGYLAGHNNISGLSNTAIGWKAGYNNTTGSFNTMIGYRAGYYSTGSHNIFIGTNAGDDEVSYSNTNSKFVLGNTDAKNWLKGDMTPTGNLYVNDQQVVMASSRFLKKNIHPVVQFRKYLNDLLKTPLFTYQYKSPRNQPHKTRIGVISEELPQNLKIQTKSGLPHPDWPTVYGSFWASLKALHEIKKELKEQFLSKYKGFLSELQSIKKKQLQAIKIWTHHKKEIASTKSQLRQIHLEIEQIQREILKITKKFDEDWKNLAVRLSPPSTLSPSPLNPPTSDLHHIHQ